jgi:hypothetical protein
MACYSQIKVTGSEETIDLLKEFVRGETQFDLNKIVPMPEELKIEGSKEGVLAYWGLTGKMPCLISASVPKPWVKTLGITTPEAALAYLQKKNPGAIKLGEKMRENIRKHGHATWYEWRVANWGSVQNVGKSNDWEGNKILFETDWTPPVTAVRALSKKFPETSISIDYATLYEHAGARRELAGTETWEDGHLTAVITYRSFASKGAAALLHRLGIDNSDAINDETVGSEAAISADSWVVDHSERVALFNKLSHDSVPPAPDTQVSNLEEMVLDVCEHLLWRGYLRMENKGFVPNVPLEKALEYVFDPTKPAMNRACLSFQIVACLEKYQAFALARKITLFAGESAPPRDVLARNGLGGPFANPDELAKIQAELKALNL